MALNVDLLKRLCETPGVPGREERVRELIKKEIRGLFDDVETDAMGSLICRRGPRGAGGAGGAKRTSARPKRVMLAAHMDEIGFYVRHIDNNGFIRVNAAGGFDTRNLFARRVVVCAKDGDFRGVMNPAGRPIHFASPEEKKKIPEVKEFIVDVGFEAAKVKERIRIGDMVVLDEPFAQVGDKLVGKAMDNRMACWVGIESIRALQKSKAAHACEVYVVFTVQEEVGLRGAKTAATRIQPDLGIGIDVTAACDFPGVPDDEAVTKQGEGVGLHMMDSSFIADYTLIDELEAVAKKKKIKVQRTILPAGGQDGAAIQQMHAGARAAGLVVGTRYLHTVTEMIDRRDIEAARDLIAAWLPTVK